MRHQREPTTSATLPDPVARFRRVAHEGAPDRVETVAFEARAWMRRPRTPRIPLELRMLHRLGRAFVHEIRIGRGRLSFRFGLDAYVDDRGLMKVGPSAQSGVTFDQGALIALWALGIGFPWAWEGRSDVRWEPLDDEHALFLVAGPAGEIGITVGFDPESGCPVTCEADRYKSTGPKVRWVGTSTDWRRVEGVLVPTRIEAQWADEPYPWLTMSMTSVRLNPPVDAMLDLGRAALGLPVAGAPRR